MKRVLLFAILVFSILKFSHAQQNISSALSDSTDSKDSNKITYISNLVFQYGGESKLAILPKINIYRKHNFDFINPYYGAEVGLHPLFIAAAYTFSGVVGVEKGIFNLESSLSHFRTTKVSDGIDTFKGPYSQNLLNFKLGVRIKTVTIKIGQSLLLNENIPVGNERISLLDIGNFNSNIYGIEVMIKIK